MTGELNAPVIRAHELGFSYGKEFELQDITFEVRPGEVFCIMGPNGSGKTSLLRVLAGSYLPMTGDVYMDELNLHRHIIQFIKRFVFMPFRPPITTLRTPFLYWHAFGLRFDHNFQYTREKIFELAPQMDMGRYMHKLFGMLSFGMMQKSALVAAFIPEVKVRILDEPFSGGIDPLAMESLAQWIESARSRGETIIFSAQAPEHAQRLADRVLVLREGRMVACATPDELVRQAEISPADPRPFVHAFVALSEGWRKP